MRNYLIFVTMPDGSYGYVNTIEANGAESAIKAARLAGGPMSAEFSDWHAVPTRNWTGIRYRSETREVAEEIGAPSADSRAQLTIVPDPDEPAVDPDDDTHSRKVTA